MADVPAATADPEIHEPPRADRRLWERFSLSVLAFLLLLLGQSSFGILVRDYSRTFELAPGLVAAYVAFGVLAGFAAGMAVVLPRRLAARHPRRGITLALLPIAVTVLNVLAVLVPGSLPEGLTLYVTTNLIGLQVAASLLLGVAVASAFADG